MVFRTSVGVLWVTLLAITARCSVETAVGAECFAGGEAIGKPCSGGKTPRTALSEVDRSKLDITPDELFYMVPRIGVYHVDEGFRAQLTELYRRLVPAGGDILDLCSQHDSHLPLEIEYKSLTVHGMNYMELMANSRATERFTRNFNSDPSLSNLEADSVDAALMTVSIQYMQRPVELLKEVKRVLKPGGVLVVSFSNRMFFQKAIEAWRMQRGMLGLTNLVTGYFEDAGMHGVRVANGVEVPCQRGDPFLAVIGFKEFEPVGLDEMNGVSWLAMGGKGSIWS